MWRQLLLDGWGEMGRMQQQQQTTLFKKASRAAEAIQSGPRRGGPR